LGSLGTTLATTGNTTDAVASGVSSSVAVEDNGVNKMQAGTINKFVEFLNNTSTQMGTLTGDKAIDAMLRLQEVGINGKPVTTPPFNQITDRYIY